MKETYWGYWLVVLGAFIVVILLLVQNVTSNNTFDSYTVKQITEASLIDAVDYGYYRDYGELRINKEKFIESFWRRFAEVASVSSKYKVLITGIYEAPPKVSVEINSSTSSYFVASSSETFDMSSRVDAILEQGIN